MPRVLRALTATAGGTVAVPDLDSATEFEACRIISGEAVRRIIGTTNKMAVWLLGTGGTSTDDIKGVFRIAGQGADLAHLQFRYYNSTSGQNSHSLSHDIAADFYDERLYAFIGGRTASERFMQVAEYDPVDEAYRFIAQATAATPAAVNSVTGTLNFEIPDVGDDVGLGASAASDLSLAGLVDLAGFYIKVGSSQVVGTRSTAAECFDKPSASSCTVLYDYTQTAGSTVTDQTGNGYDVTLGGTELVDYQWIGGLAHYGIDDDTQPSGSYIENGTTFANNRVELHTQTNNTANSADPTWGFGGAGGLGPFDIRNECVRWRIDASTAPTNWLDSSHITNAFRTDLAADGSQTGLALTWLIAPQMAGTESAPTVEVQTKVNGSTITAVFSSIDQRSGPIMIEVWHRDSDLRVRLADSDSARRDWIEAYNSVTQGHDWSSLPSALGWRIQSKNRSGATSAFGSGERTTVDEFGSGLVGVWEPSTAVTATHVLGTEHLLQNLPAVWDTNAEHLVGAPAVIGIKTLRSEHLLGLTDALVAQAEHRLGLVGSAVLQSERVGTTLRSDALETEHLVTTSTVTNTEVLQSEHLLSLTSSDVVQSEHVEQGAMATVPVSGTMLVVWGI